MRMEPSDADRLATKWVATEKRNVLAKLSWYLRRVDSEERKTLIKATANALALDEPTLADLVVLYESFKTLAEDLKQAEGELNFKIRKTCSPDR